MDVQYKKALLDDVIRNCFNELPPETGWKVLIHGIWVEKRGNAGQKRLYRSRDAAKICTEQEFKSCYFMWFDKDCDSSSYFEPASKGGVQVRDRDAWDAFKIAKVRGFRRWMNSLYADGIVRYEEVK